MAVDCGNDANSDVCTRHNITSYPTIKLIGPDYKRTDPAAPKLAERKAGDLKKAVIQTLAALKREMPVPAKLVKPKRVAALEHTILNALDSDSNVLIVAHPPDSVLGAEFALHLHQGLDRWFVKGACQTLADDWCLCFWRRRQRRRWRP